MIVSKSFIINTDLKKSMDSKHIFQIEEIGYSMNQFCKLTDSVGIKSATLVGEFTHLIGGTEPPISLLIIRQI